MNTRRLMAASVLALSATACSSFLTKQTTSSYLILDSLQASTGREPDKFTGNLASDVLTFVKKDDGTGRQVLVPTIFADNMLVTFSLGMKDPGVVGTPNAPSTTNFVTVTRYHVQFIRSDGRNTEGVDVPYAFDGAITATVGADGARATMTLVRVQSKSEAPLKALVGAAGAISTIAEITFYGKDQTGREVTVVGKISVNFADWGDPA
ncbi:MAG: hypothetical protein EPO35_09495 [Acidobacteria bacterium]|nr:MAG: hypothetical protein EPO35_09495 [Acidobacteriota bacterium]